MTELSTEPVAVEAAPTASPPTPAPQTTTAKDSKKVGVEHTPGGWPVVPLALTGANSTVGMVAAASLAGGPIAAMVAATGAVVLGTVAATRSRKPNPRRDARRTAARAAGRGAARRASLLRSGSGTGTGRAGSRLGGVPGQQRRRTGPATGHGTTSGKAPSHSKSGHGLSKQSAGGAGKGAGRVGQIRALRASQQAAAGSRAGQRTQTTAARRAVATPAATRKPLPATTAWANAGVLVWGGCWVVPPARRVPCGMPRSPNSVPGVTPRPVTPLPHGGMPCARPLPAKPPARRCARLVGRRTRRRG
jgi:hypothetical protein